MYKKKSDYTLLEKRRQRPLYDIYYEKCKKS